MKMMSRNITNMHMFLEMKQKFPDLPEDTIRYYVFMYANDPKTCISLLGEKSKRYFHISQPFSEVQKSDRKQDIKCSEETDSDSLQSENPFNIESKSNCDNYISHSRYIAVHSERSTSHPGLIHQNESSASCFAFSARSAPVLQDNTSPFSKMFSYVPSSSHHSEDAYNASQHNRITFSTTAEQTILTHNSTVQYNQPSSSTVTRPSQHSVSLNIVPSFPYQHQQISAPNQQGNSKQLGKPGMHTTSVNFQLQPPSPRQAPIKISSIPTNRNNSSSYRDFDSHVQITVGSQGGSFTALRLHRPQALQNPSINQFASSDVKQNETKHFSSQMQNSSNLQFQNSEHQSSFEILSNNNTPSLNSNDFKLPHIGLETSPQFKLNAGSKNFNNQANFIQSFQASPDYVNAVKKHQVAQLELLNQEILKDSATCFKLKSEVCELERRIVERRHKVYSFPYTEMMKKLMDENRELRVEVNCLFMEYDAASKGKIPVGITDEDFYSNIFTGPDDVYKLCSTGNMKENNTPKKQCESEDDTDDEKNKWRCKLCTFANHPALEKCEICELPKHSGSFFGS